VATDKTTGTVLIVDDEDEVRETYELYLDSGGYDIELAANGGEALVELSDDIDVVLLDRRMPGMSGDEVLEHIHDWNMGCRVVMVTAVEPGADIIEMGFDDYLTKPVQKEVMLDTIEQYLLFDQYEELLTEYHAVTRKYATLKSNLDPNQEDVETLAARRTQLREDLQETVESFTDPDIQDVFADLHGNK
jgi:CheY-like chemotaxis protein